MTSITLPGVSISSQIAAAALYNGLRGNPLIVQNPEKM
jgi:hypothetical protein